MENSGGISFGIFYIINHFEFLSNSSTLIGGPKISLKMPKETSVSEEIWIPFPEALIFKEEILKGNDRDPELLGWAKKLNNYKNYETKNFIYC